MERSTELGLEDKREVTRTAGVFGGETSGRDVRRGMRNGWILVCPVGSTYVGMVVGIDVGIVVGMVSGTGVGREQPVGEQVDPQQAREQENPQAGG